MLGVVVGAAPMTRLDKWVPLGLRDLVGLVAMGVANLFGPKWKNSDWRVRLAAVERLTDQAILAQGAETDTYRVVWLAAFEKLKDQAIFVQIATSHPGWIVRLDASKR